MTETSTYYWGHFLSRTEADRFAAMWADETGYGFAVDVYGDRYHVRRAR